MSVSKADRQAMNEMRQPCPECCHGCSKNEVIDESGIVYCKSFVIPEKRWPKGPVDFDNKCVLADHIKWEKKKSVTKVNPLKASRRANKRG